MSLIRSIRDRLDAPRFCSDDGQAIKVHRLPGYDPKTGAAIDRWVWHCPGVYASWEGGRIVWEQRGVTAVHAHGSGRPVWFGSAAEGPDAP